MRERPLSCVRVLLWEDLWSARSLVFAEVNAVRVCRSTFGSGGRVVLKPFQIEE